MPIGILSELVLNATPNSLYRHTISPEVEMEIGIIANDLSDLTPVASALAHMVREKCESYASGQYKKASAPKMRENKRFLHIFMIQLKKQIRIKSFLLSIFNPVIIPHIHFQLHVRI